MIKIKLSFIFCIPVLAIMLLSNIEMVPALADRVSTQEAHEVFKLIGNFGSTRLSTSNEITFENSFFATQKTNKLQVLALSELLKLGLPTCKKFAYEQEGFPFCSGKPVGKISVNDSKYGLVTSPTGDGYSGAAFKRSSATSVKWKLAFTRGGGLNPCSHVYSTSKIPIPVLIEFGACFQDETATSQPSAPKAKPPTTFTSLIGEWRMHAGGLVINANKTGTFSYPRVDPETIQNNFFTLKFKVIKIVGGLAVGSVLLSDDPLAPKGSIIKFQKTSIGVTVIFPLLDSYSLCDNQNWLLGECGV